LLVKLEGGDALLGHSSPNFFREVWIVVVNGQRPGRREDISELRVFDLVVAVNALHREPRAFVQVEGRAGEHAPSFLPSHHHVVAVALIPATADLYAGDLAAGLCRKGRRVEELSVTEWCRGAVLEKLRSGERSRADEAAVGECAIDRVRDPDPLR